MQYKKTLTLAYLIAIASSIQILESLLPKPLPFLKIGLANIFVLVLIEQKTYWQALLLILMKSLIAGFIIGTIFSPTTILSITGGLLAWVSMSLLSKSGIFSIIGVSISGAVFHLLGQIFVVRLLLIKSNSIFHLIPFLIAFGLLSGSVTGIITFRLLKNRKFIGFIENLTQA